MRCEGCGATLNYATELKLTLDHNQVTVKCPLCMYIMPIVYNRRYQEWEPKKRYDERKEKWRKGG